MNLISTTTRLIKGDTLTDITFLNKEFECISSILCSPQLINLQWDEQMKFANKMIFETNGKYFKYVQVLFQVT